MSATLLSEPASLEHLKPSAKVKVLNWLGRILTYVLSFLNPRATKGTLWRIAAALTFREIRLRHSEKTDTPNPYIRFEHFFAHDEFYVDRFENLVAGQRIFVDYLSSDWFSNLSIKDRVTVTSLFRRVENSENITLALARRPLAVENLDSLKNLDQDSLPQHLFIKDEPQYSTAQSSYLNGQKALISAPTDFFSFVRNLFAKIFSATRATTAHLIGLIVSLIALPSTLFWWAGLKGKTNTALNSAAERRKLATRIKLNSSPTSISNILRKYEMNYGSNEKAIKALAHQFESTNAKSILRKSWLETIPIEHRVFVTSLLRKTSKHKTSSSNIFEPVLEGLHSKNQRDIVQITGISPAQKKELALFKSIKSSSNQNNHDQQNTNSQKSKVPKKSDTGFSLLTSEEILRRQGWSSQILNGLDLVEVIRSRNFQDVLKFTVSRDFNLTLPTSSKTQLASLAALLDAPVKSNNPNFKTVDKSLKATARTLESPTQMARLMNAANSEVLPYEDENSLTIRNIWVRIAKSEDDQVGFSEAIETLIAAYDAQPQAKLSIRSVSFDTFLILDLGTILDRMKMWIDWELCGRGSIAAFAHLATLANDSKLFETAIDHIEGIRGVPKAFIGGLRNSFLSVGIHTVKSLAPGAEHTQHLEELDPKKKYLCLVEGGAGIRALRRLNGITENVVCGPVIPTDAPRYPAAATLKHIDNYIPKYSKRDMELAYEIDSLVETYIQKASDIIRATGVNERYAEAVEIAHATMFFGIYQEALAVDVCETLLKDAKDYDGVIFLMNSANALGTLLPDALKVFGDENVYVGIENTRVKGVNLALKNIRQQLSPSKSTVAKPVPETQDWAPAFSKWLSATMNKHEKHVTTLRDKEYALLTLEHLNGYHDSYIALTNQSLKHMAVELFTSKANPALNDYISEGGFAHYDHSLTHCDLNERPAPSRDWMPSLIAELKQTFEATENPWFPKYKNMIHLRAEIMLTNRLPQILDAVSYFRARFSHNRPQYVFTGPNQHTISRAASYAAMALNIPVYDFLILASTHHPRYRHPVAKYAYIYDPWYRDIFEDYMRMPADRIRVSGPLFDYGKRLSHSPAPSNNLKDKTHIVFFSQSGNFQNSCNMLEGIIKGSKKHDDIYITVKMHPHESPANLKHYENFAADLGVTDNINLIHQGDAVALINEADLVVQSFSNVGLDALLMKTPVITFKPPSNLKARIFLYEKDIGHVVKTKTALAKKVNKFLSDPEDKVRMQEIANSFALENDHFLRPDNAERVMAEVLNDIGKTPKAS